MRAVCCCIFFCMNSCPMGWLATLRQSNSPHTHACLSVRYRVTRASMIAFRPGCDTKKGVWYRMMLQFFFFISHIFFPASGQAMVTGRCRSFSPRFLTSFFIAHRVQQSNCSWVFHGVLLTHALARFPQVNLCTRKSPHEFIRVCPRGDSKSRNWPRPGSRIT